MMVHIPSQVAGDSQIPFTFGDKIRVTIETQNGSSRMIIEKVEREPKTRIQEESTKTSKPKPNEDIMNRQLSETDTIICTKCNKKNLLLNKTSSYRRCTHCGHEMLKADFVYYRPDKVHVKEESTVKAQQSAQPEQQTSHDLGEPESALKPTSAESPETGPKKEPTTKPFHNSDILKCPSCGTDNIVIPGGTGRKCRNCGFRIKHALDQAAQEK